MNLPQRISYRAGTHRSELGLRVRLVAVGASRNDELADAFPEVTQLIWPEVLAFIWDRFHTYRRQKTQVDQWDAQGRMLKATADRFGDPGEFVAAALAQLGVRRANG